MTRAFAALATTVLLVATPALGQAPPRVRGVVQAIDEGHVTIRGRDGGDITLETGPFTEYANVVPSRFDQINVGDFVGTASKGSPGHWVAVEVVIIPADLQAGRKGFAGWDALPDTSSPLSSGMTQTTMTNGSVTRMSQDRPGSRAPGAAIGSVPGGGDGSTDHVIGLTLVGGRSARIFSSSTIPVTRFIRTDRSTLTVGSTVFIKTDSGERAMFVAVGKGVVPPM